MERLIAKFPELPKKRAALSTVAQSTTVVGAMYAFETVRQRLNIPIGSGLDTQTLEDIPIDTILAPIVEEAVFRSLPQAVSRSKDTNWKLGLPTTAVFALLYNFRRDGSFETKKVPLYEFAEGLLLWRIMSKKGYANAVIAHATINLLWHGISIAENIIAKRNSEKKD